MTQPFTSSYAELYDQFYRDKDYPAECDLLEEMFRRHRPGQVRCLLDLGCGTGNHAWPLASRGYQVTGVDRSPEMLARARQKTATAAGAQAPEFLEGDLRSLNLGRRFDAVLMMFAVLSYQLTNAQVQAALAAVHRHLKPGGLFLADLWYGPAVLAQRPGDRVKVIPLPAGQIIRTASATLDIQRHLCEVRYHLWHLQGRRLLQESREIHQVRFFFPQELAFFMSQAGLECIALSAFPNYQEPPGESTWNVMVVGKSPD